MIINCPYCDAENDIPTEEWPSDCSTTELWGCRECEKDFEFGVICEIELR